MTILVSGGTGNLGRPTVELLRTRGHDVRVLSRTAAPGRWVASLESGEGLDVALSGVETVLHLANGGSREAVQTQRLATAATAAGVGHLLYMSIVGVDVNPFPYYRQKLAAERAVEASGVPWTILRATQFHGFVAALLRPQAKWPVAVVPRIPLQPIAVEEVAARVAELATAGPAGRVPEIEGPEQDGYETFAAQWFAAHGTRKRIWRLSIPGKSMRAYRSGANLGRLPGYGRVTFAEFAEADAEAAGTTA